MSAYYGRIQGSRGEATRCGSAASGISATAETWGSIVRVTQHGSSQSASGHEATVFIGGKYGGDCLALRFDADTLYNMSDHEDVQNALDAVREAMRRADETAQRIAHEGKTA